MSNGIFKAAVRRSKGELDPAFQALTERVKRRMQRFPERRYPERPKKYQSLDPKVQGMIARRTPSERKILDREIVSIVNRFKKKNRPLSYREYEILNWMQGRKTPGHIRPPKIRTQAEERGGAQPKADSARGTSTSRIPKGVMPSGWKKTVKSYKTPLSVLGGIAALSGLGLAASHLSSRERAKKLEGKLR